MSLNKALLTTLEAHRAYQRILLREIVNAQSQTCDNEGAQHALFAFEIEDDRLAALLNEVIKNENE